MIRAIFLANLLYVVLAFVGGAAAGLVYAVALVLHAGGGNAVGFLGAIRDSPTFGYVAVGVAVFAEIWAGAAAGWMAKENMLVAGLFSNLLPFLGALLRSWALSYLGPNYHPNSHITLPPIAPFLTGYAAPLLGAVGSIIAACTGFRVIFRWFAMLVIGFLIYAAIFGIAVRANLRFVDIAAATLAIGTGVFVAPPEHRAQAFLVLVFLAIFVPLATLAWQLQGPAGSTMTNLLWATFNAAGCAIAFLWVRRQLHSGYNEPLAG